jgi:hypothetical protein
MSRALKIKFVCRTPIRRLQTWYQTRVSQPFQRDLLAPIEFDRPKSRRIEQHRHDTVMARDVPYGTDFTVN